MEYKQWTKDKLVKLAAQSQSQLESKPKTFQSPTRTHTSDAQEIDARPSSSSVVAAEHSVSAVSSLNAIGIPLGTAYTSTNGDNNIGGIGIAVGVGMGGGMGGAGVGGRSEVHPRESILHANRHLGLHPNPNPYLHPLVAAEIRNSSVSESGGGSGSGSGSGIVVMPETAGVGANVSVSGVGVSIEGDDEQSVTAAAIVMIDRATLTLPDTTTTAAATTSAVMTAAVDTVGTEGMAGSSTDQSRERDGVSPGGSSTRTQTESEIAVRLAAVRDSFEMLAAKENKGPKDEADDEYLPTLNFSLVSFISFPFVLSSSSKAAVLECDATQQMRRGAYVTFFPVNIAVDKGTWYADLSCVTVTRN